MMVLMEGVAEVTGNVGNPCRTPSSLRVGRLVWTDMGEGVPL